MGKVVYIIGAGASAEVGLPVGKALAATIASSLRMDAAGFSASSDDQGAIQAIHMVPSSTTPMPREDLFAASRLISGSLVGAQSIDNFIDQHRDDKAVALCGKIAIARAILRAEARSKIFVDESSRTPFLDLSKALGTWYLALWHKLTEGCTLAELSDRLRAVAFVVFNYDRCLEHWLWWAIRRHYKADAATATKLVSAMQIVHVYGQVGTLAWQSAPPDTPVAAFGADLHPSQMLALSSCIKTFTERADRTAAAFEAVKKELQDADRIAFLGFAYHKLNLDLILPRGTLRTVMSNEPDVIGTAFGISDHDQLAIASDIAGRFSMSRNKVLLDGSAKCGTLFERHSWRLSLT